MATLAEVEQRRQATLDLTALAVNDTNYLVRELANEDPALVKETLSRYLPTLVDPYAAAIGEVAINGYMDDRAAAGLTRPYPAPARAALPTAGRAQALAGWAGQTLIDNPELIALAAMKLAGGVSRLLFDVQRDTTWDLADGDSATVRYQRMASPGCCAFCAMLASRGAVYNADSATKVVGRGVPVGRDAQGNRIDGAARGRTGKGIRARGMQRMGEKYHDHCRCVGVAVHEGRAQQMSEAAEKWYEIYADAFHSANSKFEYGHESWSIPVTYDVNGKTVTYHELQTRSFWVDDRKGTPGYGDEVQYSAFQSQLLSDMRKIAAEDYDVVLK